MTVGRVWFHTNHLFCRLCHRYARNVTDHFALPNSDEETCDDESVVEISGKHFVLPPDARLDQGT